MAEKNFRDAILKSKWQARRDNPITGRWVLFYDCKEMLTPYNFRKSREETASCCFCGGKNCKTALESKIISERSKTEQIIVVPSPKYIQSIDIEIEKMGEGKQDFETGYGADEIIIETPFHNKRISAFSEEHIADVFSIYQDRIKGLMNNKKINHVSIFKNFNYPPDAERHEYSRLLASSHVSELFKSELEGALQYFKGKERCGWCDTKRELTLDLLVLKEGSILAYAPYASSKPYEICIQSIEHNSNFADAKKEIENLASVYKKVYSGFERLWPDIPMNLRLDNLLRPAGKKEEEAYHWHLVMWPSLITGFESCDLDVNLAMPEKVADEIRQKIEEMKK